jgi:hypothetical protein
VKRILLVPVLLTLSLAACRTDRVDLTYKYDAESQVRYRLTTVAEARWNIEGRRGSGAYEITYDVTETIEQVRQGNAVVGVTMEVVDFEERGLAAPGRSSFKLRLGPAGEKLEVLDLDGVPATELAQEQLALINTFRPPLPIDPMPLHGTWSGRQAFNFPNVSQEIVAEGELTALRVSDGRELAELDYAWDGPYQGTLTLPQGTAEFKGTEEVDAVAVFDLTGGFPRSQESTLVDRFDVAIQADDGSARRQGVYSAEIHSELEFLDGSG